MRNIRETLSEYLEKYSNQTVTCLLVLYALGCTACSTRTSDETQAAQQTTVIQGDAIDAPAVVSAPQNVARETQQPESLPAQNSSAAAKSVAGPKPSGSNSGVMPSSSVTAVAAGVTATSSSPSTEKISSPAATPEDKIPAVKSLPAAASPAATPAAQAATSPATPAASNNSEYQRITLGLLGSFRYEYPDPTYLESEKDPAQLKLKDQFPPNIKALHGKKISIMGYIMPIDVDEEWRVKTLTLVRDQMVCCFGNVPEINEWVYVRLKTPQRADQMIDVPVIVFGTLEVGEEIQSGTLANVYRVEADRVSTNY
jgi:hypothetical protein